MEKKRLNSDLEDIVGPVRELREKTLLKSNSKKKTARRDLERVKDLNKSIDRGVVLLSEPSPEK